MRRIAVTLLSGGLDSTVVSAYAKNQVDNLTSLTFHYGQANQQEIRSARKVSEILGISHKIVDISSFKDIAWFSALTNESQFPIPTKDVTERPTEASENASERVPITYVPMRNTFFLAMAGALLESEALSSIESDNTPPRNLQTTLFIAPNAIDYSGYPDCRPEYYNAMRETMMIGSKLWAQYKVPITIETPIIHLAKHEIIKLGMDLNAPLENTWSCYSSQNVPCMKCDSCVIRAKGFKEAGISDPLLTALTDDREGRK